MSSKTSATRQTSSTPAQGSFFDSATDPVLLQQAVERFAAATQASRGAVFTRGEVVEFILDLVGYTTDAALDTLRVLEPAFGAGDFLLLVVQRLLGTYQATAQPGDDPVARLAPCIRAVELNPTSFAQTRAKVAGLLRAAGLSTTQCATLLATWLHQGDYLLTPLPDPFTHVVGNPPYVRQELIPAPLLAEYRARFATLYDRADLYIPFMGVFA